RLARARAAGFGAFKDEAVRPSSDLTVRDGHSRPDEVAHLVPLVRAPERRAEREQPQLDRQRLFRVFIDREPELIVAHALTSNAVGVAFASNACSKNFASKCRRGASPMNVLPIRTPEASSSVTESLPTRAPGRSARPVSTPVAGS